MTFKDFLKGAGMTAAAVALGILAGRELGHLGENLIKKGERIKNPQQLERKVQEPDISGVVRVPKGTSMDFYPDGTHSQPKPINENKLEGSLLAYAEYTGNFEGRRNKIYDPNPDDDKSEPTIGVGHYLDRGDSKEVFTRVLPEVDYNAIYAGKQELTTEQINRLFAYDIKKYVEKTKKLFPKFDSYPKYLRQALVDGCFRGELSGSPKTRRLINTGKFKEAAREYINNKQYQNAVKLGVPGIRPRMESNRDAMLRYAEEVKSPK